mmetsp:Transcript_48669/g.125488  ORF Transcript_48669/g.125488 Transcript_48669/m.125488 type:complete len:205 (-) Transcript_48669:1104-1718(-)
MVALPRGSGGGGEGRLPAQGHPVHAEACGSSRLGVVELLAVLKLLLQQLVLALLLQSKSALGLQGISKAALSLLALLIHAAEVVEISDQPSPFLFKVRALCLQLLLERVAICVRVLLLPQHTLVALLDLCTDPLLCISSGSQLLVVAMQLVQVVQRRLVRLLCCRSCPLLRFHVSLQVASVNVKLLQGPLRLLSRLLLLCLRIL